MLKVKLALLALWGPQDLQGPMDNVTPPSVLIMQASLLGPATSKVLKIVSSIAACGPLVDLLRKTWMKQGSWEILSLLLLFFDKEHGDSGNKMLPDSRVFMMKKRLIRVILCSEK